MTDEQFEQIKKEVDQEEMIKDFDPTDREPNAVDVVELVLLMEVYQKVFKN
jgi:hypothetical protein